MGKGGTGPSRHAHDAPTGAGAAWRFEGDERGNTHAGGPLVDATMIGGRRAHPRHRGVARTAAADHGSGPVEHSPRAERLPWHAVCSGRDEGD
jgi:hypothetical protein